MSQSETLTADLCVIGAGSGGLSVAAGASQMGASVVLIEKHRMGGDCLNTGCVPSKALLAAGHAAQAVRRARAFGIETPEPVVDFGRVRAHVHGTIAAIEPNDSVERFEGLGVRVIRAAARFTGRTRVTAGDVVVNARRVVVATGSAPMVPPVPGLGAVPFLTNETVFDTPVRPDHLPDHLPEHLPEHLIIIGGGPIGIEMAQAHRHLGSTVTVLELFSILPKDEPELADVVRRRLLADGVEVLENVAIERIEPGPVAVLKDGRRIAGSHLLVAAGRRANVDGLDLEAAGIAYSPKGIRVDARLRTSNRKVFAIGDVAGGPQFTHVAGYHAGVVIKNALFRLPAKVDLRALPWVTYTAPELAQVGLTEAMARAAGHRDLRLLRWPFADNDRARAEGETEGLVKVVATPKGRILGAGIAGPHAGELIQPWGLAIAAGLKVGALAQIIAPYPTLGEVSKRAAGSFYTSSLFSERTRRIVRFLARFG